MQDFTLDPSMLTMGGVFYPTGYVFAMFPSEQDARATGEALEREKLSEKPVMLVPPQVVLEQVVRTVGSADIPLPSPGTEAAVVRQYAALAGQGHWALMVHAPDGDATANPPQRLDKKWLDRVTGRDGGKPRSPPPDRSAPADRPRDIQERRPTQ